LSRPEEANIDFTTPSTNIMAIRGEQNYVLITLFGVLLPLLATVIGIQCINSIGCQVPEGQFYTGYAHRTKYGDPCDEWQRHTDNEWAVDHFDHNYCRRPHLKGQSSNLHGLRNLRQRLQRDGVWCYTGKGNTWEYCNVPRCPPSPIDGHAEGPKNATELEQNGEEAINVATIILGTATLNVVILICLTFLKQRFQLHGQDDFMIDLFAPW